LAEFERDLIRERTQAGLRAARARGRQGGRPKKLGTEKDVARARALYASQTMTVAEICKSLGISRATFYRAVGKSNLLHCLRCSTTDRRGRVFSSADISLASRSSG
jgi:DNA invertase Pin-like site-specific DNA recombinase